MSAKYTRLPDWCQRNLKKKQQKKGRKGKAPRLKRSQVPLLARRRSRQRARPSQAAGKRCSSPRPGSKYAIAWYFLPSLMLFAAQRVTEQLNHSTVCPKLCASPFLLASPSTLMVRKLSACLACSWLRGPGPGGPQDQVRLLEDTNLSVAFAAPCLTTKARQ